MQISGNEISELSGFVVSSIAPYIPRLLHLGKEGIKTLAVKATEEVGKGVGEGGWNLAKDLWAKLWPKIEKSASTRDDVEEFGRNPQDQYLKNVLDAKFARLLGQDQDLLKEIKGLLRNTGVSTMQIAVANHGAISIVGPLSNSPVTTNFRDLSETSIDERNKKR